MYLYVQPVVFDGYGRDGRMGKGGGEKEERVNEGMGMDNWEGRKGE